MVAIIIMFCICQFDFVDFAESEKLWKFIVNYFNLC